MTKIVSLCKRRGFIFPGSELYGGLAGTWDYGPLGVALKSNIKKMWWRRFVHMRDDMEAVDTAIIMNPRVWEASGHVETFTDPLVECKNCHERFRADNEDAIKDHKEWHNKKKEKAEWAEARQFNLLFRTFTGAVEDSASQTYLRPETAQGIFINFKNVLETSRRQLPFGIAQIGKAFRNEITPRDFIFRSREFEQMEIEYFVREEEWKEYFEHWTKEMEQWIRDMGIDMSRMEKYDVPKDELAHYSRRTIDFMYDFPFGRKELYGLAYRTDFDLKNHFTEPPYRDEKGNSFYPHVIEPSFGIDRTVLAVLLEAYREQDSEKGKRVYLSLPSRLAPFCAAVFPLVANKENIREKARSVYELLKPRMRVVWDDRGNIGKRYYAQDEIGTPFCITIDYQTLDDDTVTIRDRNTAQQERIQIKEIKDYIINTSRIIQ